MRRTSTRARSSRPWTDPGCVRARDARARAGQVQRHGSPRRPLIVARVELATSAVEDLDRLIRSHSLPADTRQRIQPSLSPLERFPALGAELEGRWADHRFVLGPWRWMIVVYVYLDDEDRSRHRHDPGRSVLGVHVGRRSPTVRPRTHEPARRRPSAPAGRPHGTSGPTRRPARPPARSPRSGRRRRRPRSGAARFTVRLK